MNRTEQRIVRKKNVLRQLIMFMINFFVTLKLKHTLI